MTFKTKVDLARQVQSVVELLSLEVLLLDEVRLHFTHIQVHHSKHHGGCRLWMTSIHYHDMQLPTTNLRKSKPSLPHPIGCGLEVCDLSSTRIP